MNQNLSLLQSYVRTRIIGIILILAGLGLFLNPTSLNMKIGFASILIGVLMVFIITKKSAPLQMGNVQIKGNVEAVKKIIRELHLTGNAIFLPKTENLTEERIIIPPNNSDIIQIPSINNDNVFLTRWDSKNLGISMPPSGLQLLNEIEKKGKFENTKIEDADEKLQIFVGMDLIKSLSLKEIRNCWKLEIEKPIFCPNDTNLCKQYPCPTCSAILTAIARTSNGSHNRLWIKDIKNNGNKMAFYLYFMKKKANQDGITC